MSKRNKILIISSVCVVIFLTITICLGLFVNSIIPETYSSAKKECEEILLKNQAEMEQIAIESLESEKQVSGDYRDYFYCSFPEYRFVQFEIGGQGMLGGQYWELVYTKDGTLWGETDVYFNEEDNGNNIVKAERLNGNWWYFWTDYDGTERSFQ